MVAAKSNGRLTSRLSNAWNSHREEDGTIDSEAAYIKQLETNIKYQAEIINTQRVELEILRQSSSANTVFLQQTVLELVRSKNTAPAPAAVASTPAAVKPPLPSTASARDLVRATPSAAGKLP